METPLLETETETRRRAREVVRRWRTGEERRENGQKMGEYISRARKRTRARTCVWVHVEAAEKKGEISLRSRRESEKKRVKALG